MDDESWNCFDASFGSALTSTKWDYAPQNYGRHDITPAIYLGSSSYMGSDDMTIGQQSQVFAPVENSVQRQDSGQWQTGIPQDTWQAPPITQELSMIPSTAHREPITSHTMFAFDDYGGLESPPSPSNPEEAELGFPQHSRTRRDPPRNPSPSSEHKLQSTNPSLDLPHTTQPKNPAPRSKSKPTKSTRKSAHDHNKIEKQYRTRLSAQFVQLLARIPPETVNSHKLQCEWGKGVSKVETLVMAEQYIKTLEREERRLSAENRELVESFERLKREWVLRGGLVLP